VSYLQVVEVEPDSNAWQAGIRKGDILYLINKQRIRNHDEALEILGRNQDGIILNIQRGGRELYLLLK